jgi:chromosomal replication initiator protein
VPARPEETWSQIRSELQRVVPDTTYQLWLEPLELLSLDDGRVVLGAPEALRTWVADRHGRTLRTCAGRVLGDGVTVEVVGLDDAGARGAPVPEAPPSPLPAAAPEGFNPRYTFEQFIIGDTNRMAHAAALTVAELPGQAYNPLFVCGPPGVGKTHLLHAIGNYLSAHDPSVRVRYATAETFTNEFVRAVQDHAIEPFKARYRDVDLLLVDDVQFLERKTRTVEEFFHTFNAVFESGAQLVLTSDRMPRDILELEERLRARFESGLVADMGPPDHETRMTYLRKRARLDEVQLADEAPLERLASVITDSIRALQGAFIRVVAFHSLRRRPIDPELVDEVLQKVAPERAARARAEGPITVDAVQATVADTFGVTVDELRSDTRAARVSWPRQLAMYLSRELTDASLPQIGRAFARNHATVVHSCKRVAERIGEDPEALQAVNSLSERLRSA